jgi:hypothetical protein
LELLVDVDRDASLVLGSFELYSACNESEKRVVSADADVRTRVELGSTLANEDFAGLHDLTAVSLHA